MEDPNTQMNQESRERLLPASDVDNQNQLNLNTRETKKKHGFFMHLRLLLRKNYFVQKRSLKSLLIQLFMPIAICGIIYLLQLSANSVVGKAVTDPDISAIGKIPQCFFNPENPNNCSTITYGIVVRNLFSFFASPLLLNITWKPCCIRFLFSQFIAYT